MLRSVVLAINFVRAIKMLHCSDPKSHVYVSISACDLQFEKLINILSVRGEIVNESFIY